MVADDEAEAKKTDLAYQTPDVMRQRMRTLETPELWVSAFSHQRTLLHFPIP